MKNSDVNLNEILNYNLENLESVEIYYYSKLGKNKKLEFIKSFFTLDSGCMGILKKEELESYTDISMVKNVNLELLTDLILALEDSNIELTSSDKLTTFEVKYKNLKPVRYIVDLESNHKVKDKMMDLFYYYLKVLTINCENCIKIIGKI